MKLALLGGLAAAIVLTVLEKRARVMGQPNKQNIVEKGKVAERHKELFHYTSITALKGILATNSLWATKTTHLNDRSEMELIWPSMEEQVFEQYKAEILDYVQRYPVVKGTFAELGGVDQIAKEEASRMVSGMHLKLVGNDETPGIVPKYVVSFATHSSDSPQDKYHRTNGMLSQWRAYGRDKPVAIVFDASGLHELLHDEVARFLYWTPVLGEVTYLDKDLSLKECFPDLFDALRTCARNFIEPRDGDFLQDVLPKAYEQASVACARLKHYGFHEEQECRIVVEALPEPLRERLSAEGTKTQRSVKEVHRRRGCFGPIPYVALFDDLGKDLPINRIIVGPSRDQAAHYEAVRRLVKSRGIPVQKSETPYVGSA